MPALLDIVGLTFNRPGNPLPLCPDLEKVILGLWLMIAVTLNVSSVVSKALHEPELQIRDGTEANSKIIFLISQQKHML